MNRISAAFFLLVVSSCASKPNITCNRVDPLTKVFPEDVAFMQASDTAYAAAGTHVEFQFALHPGAEVRDFTVTCSDLASAEGSVIPAPVCGVVGYVGVGTYADYPAHDVIHRSSGVYPDPILEKDSYDFPAFGTFCAWITVTVPPDAAAGAYKANVEMKGRCAGNRFCFREPIIVKVYPVSMRKPTFNTTHWAFDNQTCLKAWNGGEAVAQGSAPYWQYIDQLSGMLSDIYQTTTRVNIFETIQFSKDASGSWQFDFSLFDALVSRFKKHGINQFVYGGDLGRRVGGGWASPAGLNVPVGDYSKTEAFLVDDPRVRDFYESFLPAFRQHLYDRGWLETYVQQVADEPSDLNVDSYIKTVAFLRSYWPDLKVFEACQTTDKAVGAINIWCPQLDHWHNGNTFFNSRQEAGDKVWFYTCCYPRAAYPNRFIEQPLLKGRMLLWMAFKYKADGYLHWGFNYWSEDCCTDTAVPGIGTVLPGGDSWIIYPAYHQMLRSIRYEQHRDGVEDLTLLQMLAEKNPAKAEALADTLVYNWWVYCGSPVQFRQIHKALLEALVQDQHSK